MTFNHIAWPYRFLFLLVFSVALMIVDHRSHLLIPVRTAVSALGMPFQLLIRLPSETHAWFAAHWPDDRLYQQYSQLKAKQTVLESRLQRYDALMVENQRLAKLLEMSREYENQALLADIVEFGLDPYTRRVVINRGTEAGAYMGQPVATTDGVLGQISGLGLHRSVVTLITDPSHALPVQIQRNGLRTIVRGLGLAERIELPFLPASTDIRVGDVLVTSGLGGGFPPGYRVAQVRAVVVDVNKPFLNVVAAPFLHTNRIREVLLLWVAQVWPVAGEGDDNGDE